MVLYQEETSGFGICRISYWSEHQCPCRGYNYPKSLYYKGNDLSNVVIEIDSLGMRKILSQEWKIPWEIVHIVEEIQEMREFIVNQVQHIYSKGKYFRLYSKHSN